MKYISHIKELVSGILDNETVTRDTEAYNALTALKNHLESLEEVQKYMPYKDPGPVIRNLEQSLAKATTKNQELQKQILYFDEELEKKNKSRDQCYQYWQEYKSKYETLEQKNRQDNKELEQFQSQIEDLNEDLQQKNTYIEDLKKQTSDAQCELDNCVNYKGPDFENQIHRLEEKLRIAESIFIGEQETRYKEQTARLEDPYYKTLVDKKQEEISFLVGILSEEQLGEYQEYLRTQLPDDQPQYGPRHISRSKKRR